ncbi:MAG: class I SAM-dependent methyltransferase [Planctomycetota bacterium]|nr:class I SAM-dependent methyltransferase [Planctomycetota bacterium]
MITVLKNCSEVDDALSALRADELPLHVTPQKNWDHLLIKDLVQELVDEWGKDLRILDMGSGDGYTLEFLHRLGFANLQGIDLHVPWRRRLKRLLRFWPGRPFAGTDVVRRGDMCRTGLPPASVDLITSVSVIEHSVPTQPFLAECARLLKPGGLLFVTTDYWDDIEMNPAKDVQLFSLDWTIQNREMITDLIHCARESGLELLKETEIPPVEERTVTYYGYDYTFIALEFTRKNGAPAG